MNLTINRVALAAALRTCAAVADSKSPTPILAMTRLTAKGKSLRCVATDLNLAVTVDVPCEGDGGDVLVPADVIAKAIDVLPGAEVMVTLTVERTAIVCKAGKSKQTIGLGPSPRDYPKLPVVDGDWQSVETAALEAVLKGCQPAICKDETRFHLNGVLLSAGNGLLVGLSTDGHRGHFLRRSCDATFPPAIVPGDGVKAILAMLPGVEAVEIACSTHHRHVRAGATVLSAKLISEEFPPMGQIIPAYAGETAGVEVGRAELIAALRRTKHATDDMHGVRVIVGDDGLTLSSQLADKNIATEDGIDAATGDLRIVIGARASYLTDAATLIDGERVLLRFGGELDPIVVTALGDALTPTAGSGVVIMPMRI
jgi:DNA polymerase-3 subunit beta